MGVNLGAEFFNLASIRSHDRVFVNVVPFPLLPRGGVSTLYDFETYQV